MNNVEPIHPPNPVMLALASGRIHPQMVEGFLKLYAEDPNALLSVLAATPAESVLLPGAREAQFNEINRFARQRGISFGDAYLAIHRLANQVLREPVFGFGPEAA